MTRESSMPISLLMFAAVVLLVGLTRLTASLEQGYSRLVGLTKLLAR